MDLLEHPNLKSKQRYALPLEADKGTICALGEMVSAKYEVVTEDGVKSLREVVKTLNGVISRPLRSALDRGEDVTSLYVYPETYHSEGQPKFIAYIDNRYSRGNPKYGERFRIAHELGHYFLHAKIYNSYFYRAKSEAGNSEIGLIRRDENQSQLLKKQAVLANFWGGHYYLDNPDTQYIKNRLMMAEAEAYNFSMSMLMPSTIFEKHWKSIPQKLLNRLLTEINERTISEAREIVKNDEAFLKEIGELTAFFKVSIKRILGRATCLRLLNLKMDQYDA